MSRNYLIYPCRTMRITQSYKGRTSHLPHTTGIPKDYPVDEGCSTAGRDYCYCPCDEMKIKRIYGVGTKGTNTIWLQSTSKVCFADGSEDYFTMLITHPDDSEIKKLKAGQTFRRKEKICLEGKDGASAYHFHFSGGKGKYKDNGWVKNSNGKWVLTTKNGTAKPEKLFFIDTEFTTVKDNKGLRFKELPSYPSGVYTVVTEELNVRKGPSADYGKISFKSFTAEEKAQIQKLKGTSYRKCCFVKGMTVSITETEDNWGRCSSGWICLDYCEKK